RKAHNTNPVTWTQTYSKHDFMFQYSPNTGTSTLCGHINHHHILEYLALVEVNKWQVWLESVKAIMARGYTLNQIWEALAEGRALTLLPPCHSEALSMNSANPSDRPSIPPFLLEQLHNHLVAFIIADDQVWVIYSHLTKNYNRAVIAQTQPLPERGKERLYSPITGQ
ncbi:hypothetical protein PAXRUDRAFT_177272, partial [Paxillus rubicundulus Ve08.2h10]